MASYLIRVGDALSQFLNVVFLNGSPNESLSGRAHRTNSGWEQIIDALFWFDKDHCLVAYTNDLIYAHKYIKGDMK